MTENGINGLDVIPSEPLKSETFAKAVVMLEQNYGMPYPKEKMALLFDMIREEGWSEQRFQHTFKWFLKTKYNQAWTVSDWFTYGVKLYPESWYKKQVAEIGDAANRTIERYRLPNGSIGYKWLDGEKLPLEYLGTLK